MDKLVRKIGWWAHDAMKKDLIEWGALEFGVAYGT